VALKFMSREKVAFFGREQIPCGVPLGFGVEHSRAVNTPGCHPAAQAGSSRLLNANLTPARLIPAPTAIHWLKRLT
jgi:hypothetical protein